MVHVEPQYGDDRESMKRAQVVLSAVPCRSSCTGPPTARRRLVVDASRPRAPMAVRRRTDPALAPPTWRGARVYPGRSTRARSRPACSTRLQPACSTRLQHSAQAARPTTRRGIQLQRCRRQWPQRRRLRSARLTAARRFGRPRRFGRQSPPAMFHVKPRPGRRPVSIGPHAAEPSRVFHKERRRPSTIGACSSPRSGPPDVSRGTCVREVPRETFSRGPLLDPRAARTGRPDPCPQRPPPLAAATCRSAPGTR